MSGPEIVLPEDSGLAFLRRIGPRLDKLAHGDLVERLEPRLFAAAAKLKR